MNKDGFHFKLAAYRLFIHPVLMIARITSRHGLLLAALFSAMMLSAAFVAQYGFHLHPCDLCIKQRYPYAAIVAIGIGAAFFLKSARAQRLALMLVALLFVVDGGIAFYHAGVELGWFPGPSGCSSASTGNETLEDLRRQIMEAPLVTCDQAMAHVLGLSLAAWNALAAFFAAAATAFYLRKTAHG